MREHSSILRLDFWKLSTEVFSAAVNVHVICHLHFKLLVQNQAYHHQWTGQLTVTMAPTTTSYFSSPTQPVIMQSKFMLAKHPMKHSGWVLIYKAINRFACQRCGIMRAKLYVEGLFWKLNAWLVVLCGGWQKCSIRCFIKQLYDHMHTGRQLPDLELYGMSMEEWGKHTLKYQEN